MRGSSRTMLFASAVAAMAFTAGCDEAPTRQQTPIFGILGSVRDAGTPLAGVRIELSNPGGFAFTYTDGLGAYAFWDLPDGEYQVTPMETAEVFRPVSRVVQFGDSTLAFNHFTLIGGPAHSITGSLGGVIGARVTLAGSNTGDVLSSASGGFAFQAVRLGSYTVTPTKEGITFVPASRTVQGVFDVTHATGAAAGALSVASVTADGGATDASPFIAFAGGAAGSGTLRVRAFSELSAPDSTAFEPLWQGAATITVTLNTAAGAHAVAVHLLPNRTYSATSVNFSVSERLMNATGLTFVVAP